MSRWDAVSDLDYDAEMNPNTRGIERHCSRCPNTVYVSRDEPYRVQVLCDTCWQLAVATQGTRIAEAVREIKAKTEVA